MPESPERGVQRAARASGSDQVVDWVRGRARRPTRRASRRRSRRRRCDACCPGPRRAGPGRAELDDLAPDLGVRAGVRQQRRSGTSRRRPADARHWKNSAPSAPRATCARLLRRSSPGVLARLRGCQLTADCRVLHEQPRLARRRSAAGQVGATSDSSTRGRVERAVEVVVVGDDVHAPAPRPSSPCRDVWVSVMKFVVTGTSGRDRAQQVALAPEACRAARRRRTARSRAAASGWSSVGVSRGGRTSLPVGVVLAPERRAPRVVEARRGRRTARCSQARNAAALTSQ